MRSVMTLVLLCAVQFLDVVDSSIVNVALPSIQHSLHFSQQNLQWVASGYVLTYGGFLLLGGRAADLLGRRRVLVAGVVLFAVCSLAGGLATREGTLIAARILQGIGAALMAPAALSLVTTLYREGAESGRVMCIPLHTGRIGRPDAAGYLDKALQYILGHDGVWNTTADDIAEYYLANYYDDHVRLAAEFEAEQLTKAQ